MAATVKCDTLQNTSSSTANVTLDGSGNATVGNNLTVTGQTIPSSSFKRNRIINGNMAVDQRNNGASQSSSGGIVYCVDRWWFGSNGASTTGQRVAGSGSTQYRYQITGAASVTSALFGQRIEAINSYDLAGSTVTLAFDMANSLLTSVSWALSYANSTDSFGTLAAPTITQISSGTINITSTVTRYNVQISIPAAATTGLQLQLTVGAQTSGTWTIGNVQLEAGSAATPYERQIYSDQLTQCQRYYFRQTSAASDAFGVGFNNTTTTAFGLVYYPVIMRTAPTALEQSGTATNYRVRYTGSAAATCSAVPTFGTADTNCALVVFTVASGLTAGQGVTIESNASTAYLGWSAEL